MHHESNGSAARRTDGGVSLPDLELDGHVDAFAPRDVVESQLDDLLHHDVEDRLRLVGRVVGSDLIQFALSSALPRRRLLAFGPELLASALKLGEHEDERCCGEHDRQQDRH